jgi:hypothetical protein
MSFAVQAGGRNFRGDKTVVCPNCSREGHGLDTYFQLIGYPDWWGNKPRSRATGRGSGRKRSGEGGRDKGGVLRAIVTQTLAIRSGRRGATDSDRKGLSGLDDEQWSTLLEILSLQKNVSNKRLTGKQGIWPWIIDLGASYHMIGTSACLIDLSDIVPYPIGLPNGEETIALKEGIVHFGGGLKLQHVLFVPKLKYDLLSVSQLFSDSNLVLQITKKKFVLYGTKIRGG